LSKEPAPPQPTVLTVRALLLSAVSVIAITVAGNVSVLHRYEILGTGYLPRAVVFYLLALIPYNQTIGRLFPRARLRRAEVMVVFCALLATASIPAQDFAQHFHLNLAGITHFVPPRWDHPGLVFRHDALDDPTLHLGRALTHRRLSESEEHEQ